MKSSHARSWRPLACLAFAGLLVAGTTQAAPEPLAKDERKLAGRSLGEMAFDIPAQPLAQALETYSVATGREVVYNANLATGRRSAALKGAFTPETALQRLLDGTGLSPRYMAADAFVLIPVPADSRPRADAVAATHYYGRIQASLKQAFCAESRTRPGDYRVAVSFWIGSSGTISRVDLLGSTGDAGRDASVERVMRNLIVGAAPPPGFAQPVVLVIAPQEPGMTPDCPQLRTGEQVRTGEEVRARHQLGAAP